MEHQVRYQRQARPEWTRALLAHPGCERLLSCMQCGTCSGACPLALYMDVTPRRIVQLVREGFCDEALQSETIWLCASCYACASHCPQGVQITDLMQALKHEAIRERRFPRRFPVPAIARELHAMVERRGRSTTFWLMFRQTLRHNPRAALSLARAAVALFRAGRAPLGHPRIRDIAQLRRALAGSKEA